MYSNHQLTTALFTCILCGDLTMRVVSQVHDELMRSLNSTLLNSYEVDKTKTQAIDNMQTTVSFLSIEQFKSNGHSSSALGGLSVPWLDEDLSMPSPSLNYPVLCCPLPDRVAPVFVQQIVSPTAWLRSLDIFSCYMVSNDINYEILMG